MKKLTILAKVFLCYIINTIRGFRKPKRQRTQIPMKLARALKGMHPVHIMPNQNGNKAQWRVIFANGTQHVYAVNKKRSIAYMLF